MPLTEEYKAHLLSNPGSGGPIQRTGYSNVLTITPVAAIINAKTFENTNYTRVFIGNCPGFSLAVNLNLGALVTSFIIYIEFSVDGTNFYSQTYLLNVGGVTTFDQHTYNVVRNGLFGTVHILQHIFSVQNPGSNWVRFYTSSVGNVAATSKRIWMTRHWNDPPTMGFR